MTGYRLTATAKTTVPATKLVALGKGWFMRTLSVGQGSFTKSCLRCSGNCFSVLNNTERLTSFYGDDGAFYGCPKTRVALASYRFNHHETCLVEDCLSVSTGILQPFTIPDVLKNSEFLASHSPTSSTSTPWHYCDDSHTCQSDSRHQSLCDKTVRQS